MSECLTGGVTDIYRVTDKSTLGVTDIYTLGVADIYPGVSPTHAFAEVSHELLARVAAAQVHLRCVVLCCVVLCCV